MIFIWGILIQQPLNFEGTLVTYRSIISRELIDPTSSFKL